MLLECFQEKEEADELIVEIVINDSSSLTKILTARTKADQEMFFLKLGKQKARFIQPKVLKSSTLKVLN